MLNVNNLKTKLGLIGLSMVPMIASAQEATLGTEAVSSFQDAGVAIALIGGAMVAVAAAGIVYRWVTGFLLK